ncbi:MAG TPA: hypothetical protein PK047_10490 [Saprospiraceae bacterium]|nr:hypothetical protein [Saprospiraceae bacterium]HRO09284.1 hypothetical protein [Saprospiraceae bacterium]HRP42316.1 hypothetical protein [Saprospiraceae bacterium]
MRVIGEFVVGDIKVSIFKYNERISVKYEKYLLEQVYKFRDGSNIRNVNDVMKFSETIENKLNVIFDSMAQLRTDRIMELNGNDLDDFDEII